MTLQKDGGVIRSDEGWSLQALGRTRMRYTDGGREALLDCEFPFAKRGIVFYADKVVAWTIPSGVAMTLEERVLVIKRVTAALEWEGLTVYP